MGGSSTCPKSLSFAITLEDMDYPNGVGESSNHVRNMFWAVNIPSDWSELTEANAYSKYKGQPYIHMGLNDAGTNGLETICPARGLHRYRISVWALRNYISTADEPL